MTKKTAKEIVHEEIMSRDHEITRLNNVLNLKEDRIIGMEQEMIRRQEAYKVESNKEQEEFGDYMDRNERSFKKLKRKNKRLKRKIKGFKRSLFGVLSL